MIASYFQACVKGPPRPVVPGAVAAEARVPIDTLTVNPQALNPRGCPTPTCRDPEKSPVGQVTPNYIGENYIERYII